MIDDPLSALDNEMVESVIAELVSGGFQGRTRLIITHRKELALRADRVYRIREANSLEAVSKEELEAHFASVGLFASRDPQKHEEQVSGPVTKKETQKAAPAVAAEDAELKRLVNEAEGLNCKSLVKVTREMAGLFWLPVVFGVSLMASFAEPISIGYLLYWASNFDPATKWQKLLVLVSLYVVKSVFPPLRRVVMLLLFQNKLSQRLHAKMLFVVLHSSLLKFHARLPSGLIMNRMSNDLPKVDAKVIDNLSMFINLIAIMTYLSAMVLFTIHWSSGLFLLLFLAINIKIQRKFIEIRRQLIKKQSGSMTPVLDHLEDTIADLTSIRVMRLESWFFSKYQQLVDIHFNNSYLLAGFNVWFNTVMSFSSLLIVQLPCFFILLHFYTDVDWNKLVVFIVLVGNLAGDLQRFLFFLTDLDGNFVDLSRCYFFEKIPFEEGRLIPAAEVQAFHSGSVERIKNYLLTSNRTREIFPTVDSIEFKDVSASYISDDRDQLVIKQVSCSIRGREKIGIIGKTGSGKSTFVKLIWRYLKECEGTISINGVDVNTVDLRGLRKSICVLSQESHILTGSVRLNVDPSSCYGDHEVLNILSELGFENPGYLKDGLNFMLSEDGKNVSIGEKQVICLARVMLSKASVIILDEATASMDHNIDRKIKQKIYERFGGKATILIVAHRIDTVLDCDRIIAFAGGQIIEVGSPKELSEKPDSYFKRMLGETEGLETD